MADIGTAYVQIEPTAKGISGKIEKELGGVGESSGHAFNSGFGRVIGGAGAIVAGAMATGTAAMTGFAAASVQTGMAFDTSMSQVAATMGKTVDEISDLRDFAQEMGRTTAFSATQAADALNYMALAGYDADTSMQMLPNVLNLAAAGAMDLARASDMVTDTQTAFGISLDRTSQMVDEMAKAASTGNTSVEQLGDAFLTVGGLAQELNGGMIALDDGTTATVDGVQELEIALTAMANAGIKGTEAGTHMRNMLLKLSSPTDKGAQALEALGVEVFDAEGKMNSLGEIFGEMSAAMTDLTQEEKIQAISEMFNTRDIASAEALLEAVNQDWSKIGFSILDAKGAAEQMAATQLDNLAGDVTLFKSALEGAQIAISDVLAPSLREFVQFGTQGLSELTSAFQEGGLEGAMETFGKLLSEGLNMVISKLPEATNAGMKLLGALGEGLLNNLDVIIDAAVKIIGQLLTGIIQALPKVAEGGIKILAGLIDGIARMLPELIPVAVDVLMQLIEGLYNNWPMVIEAGMNLLNGLVEGIINALPVLIAALPQVIQSIVNYAVTALPMIINGLIQLINGIVQNLPVIIKALIEALPEIIQAIVDGITQCLPLLIAGAVQLTIALVAALPEIIEALVEAIPEIITIIVDTIVASAPQFLEAITSIVLSIGQLLLALGSDLVNTVSTNLSTLVTTVKTWLSQLPQQVAYFAGKMVADFVNRIYELVTRTPTTFNEVIAKVKEFGIKLIESGKQIVTDFKNRFIEGFNELPEKMLTIGHNIVEGLINGVKNAWGNLQNFVGDLCSNLIKGFTDNLQIGSPSKVFRDEVGKWIPAGLAEGIESGIGMLNSSVDDMTMAVSPANMDGVTAYTPKSGVATDNGSGQALYDLLSRYLPMLENQTNVNVTLEGDAQGLFNAVRSQNKIYKRMNGESAFA